VWERNNISLYDENFSESLRTFEKCIPRFFFPRLKHEFCSFAPCILRVILISYSLYKSANLFNCALQYLIVIICERTREFSIRFRATLIGRRSFLHAIIKVKRITLKLSTDVASQKSFDELHPPEIFLSDYTK